MLMVFEKGHECMSQAWPESAIQSISGPMEFLFKWPHY